MPRGIRSLFLHLDEESYLSRFERVKGFQYNLAETMYTVTAGPLEMPFRKLKNFPGSNRNNVLGPIACKPFNEENHNILAWKDKKTVWSTAAKLACRVGGAGEDGIIRGKERTQETQEPLCFHAYSQEVWSELIHMHSAVGVIDLTPGPGYSAEACIMSKTLFVGFVQTPAHETVVRKYLFRRLWALMQKPGSPFYEGELTSLLNNTPKSKTGGSEGGGAPQPGPPPTGGGGAPGRQSGGGAKTEPEPGPSGGAPAGSGGGANGGRNPGTKPRRRRGSNAGKPEPALKKLKSKKLLETIQKLNAGTDSEAANKSDNVESEESEADSTNDPEI